MYFFKKYLLEYYVSATKCMSLNNEQRKTRPFLSDLNSVELNYYPFMISLDKCDGNCNAFNNISGKICPK